MEIKGSGAKMKKRSTFSVLFKMALMEFKKSWAQFLAIVAIGAIAVTLFLGLLSNAECFDVQLNATYDAGNMADIWVYSMRYDSDDESYLRTQLQGGDAMDGRFMYTATANGQGVYLNIYQDYPEISVPYDIDYAEGYGPEDTLDFAFVDTTLIAREGDNFSQDFTLGKNFTLTLDISSFPISEEQKAMLNIFVQPGKENVLASGSLSLSIPLTGSMSYPENIERSNYSSSSIVVSDHLFATAFDALLRENYGDTFVDMIYGPIGQAMLGSVFESIGWNPSFSGPEIEEGEIYVPLTKPNQYLITLADDSRADAFVSTVETYFTSIRDASESGSSELSTAFMSVYTRSTQPFCLTMSSDLSQAYQLTAFFPFVFFAVAILVILTTISAIIVKDRTQIGTLKAVGVTQGEIFGYYILMTLFLVMLGTLIGAVVGPFLLPTLMQIKYTMLYNLVPLTYVFPWGYAILTALVFLGVSALVTYLVTRKEVLLMPSESMRPAPPHLVGKGASKKSKIKTNVTLLSLKMALRNIKVSLFKSAMVVVGVAGCTALLVCGYGIEDSINHSVSIDFANYMTSDVSVSLQGPLTKEGIDEAVDPLLKYLAVDESGVPEVQGYTRSTSTITFDDRSYNSFYCLLEPDSYSFVNLDFDHDKVAVSSKVESRLGVKAGDSITFTVGVNRYTAEIAEIFEAFTFHGVVLYGDAPFLGEVGTYTGIYLNAAPDVSEDQLAEAASETIGGVSSTQTSEDMMSYVGEIMASALQLTGAIKAFAILLAIVVLYNLALLNFRERQRDIATLKVLGFSRAEIALSLLFETMLLTLVGVVVGMVLGFPFMYGVLITNQVEIAQFIYYISPLTYFISFLLTFVVAFAINFFFAIRSEKVKMVDSLKSVE